MRLWGTMMTIGNPHVPCTSSISNNQVHEYIKAYAAHFRITERIKYHAKIVLLRRSSAGNGWTVLYQDSKQDKFFQVQ